MIWHERLKYQGTHAILSASSYHWINYSPEKLLARLRTLKAAEEGVALHELAHMLIRHKQILPAEALTLNLYVNDAIELEMRPEQLVFYSENAYGTADTISFDENEGLLRIHDLKTGATKTSVNQLYVYAAYFCLEYGIKPFEIRTALRIYQNDSVDVWDDADPEMIVRIMDKTVTFDRYIEEWKREALT